MSQLEDLIKRWAGELEPRKKVPICQLSKEQEEEWSYIDKEWDKLMIKKEYLKARRDFFWQDLRMKLSAEDADRPSLEIVGGTVYGEEA